MAPRIRHLLLARGGIRGALGAAARFAARRVAGHAAVDDPLDSRFLAYRGLGRRYLTLLLDATNKCNLRCVMCHFALDSVQRTPSIAWSAQDIASLEREVLPSVAQAYLSVGTEPLMAKRFPELLASMHRARVPRFEVITNGLLMTDQLAERIVRSGMARVQLSIDGATSATYESIRVGGRFEEFLLGLERLERAKRRLRSKLPELQFNVTVMRRNVDELESLVRLAAQHGVRYVDLRHVVVPDELELQHESLWHEKARANRALERVHRAAAELGVELVRCPEPFELDAPNAAHAGAASEAEDDHGDTRSPACKASAEDGSATGEPAPFDPRELPLEPLCDAPWRQLDVRPDRTVAPCCFWYTDPPLGDLRRQSLAEIVDGPAVRELRRQILTGQLGVNCASCPAHGIGSVQDPAALRRA